MGRRIRERDELQREQRPFSAQTMVEQTRHLKGAVAIAYKGTQANRKTLCQTPFRCSTIRKNFFGKPFTQLLAVKQPIEEADERAAGKMKV